MKVGFTGTRKGITLYARNKLFSVLRELMGNEFHHGDCIGADASAHTVASALEMEIHIHPPLEARARARTTGDVIYPPEHYLDRNHKIVDATQVLVACPNGVKEELRSGTWATIRYAKKQKKPIVMIYPDGSMERLNPPKYERKDAS